MDTILERLEAIEAKLISLNQDNRHGSYPNHSYANAAMHGTMIFHRRRDQNHYRSDSRQRPRFQPSRQNLNQNNWGFNNDQPGNIQVMGDLNNQVRSNNPQFPELTKRLFQYVQLRRSLDIWSNIPKTLNKQINELYDNICPPMPDTVFKELKEKAKNDLKSNMTAIMQEHVTSKMQGVDSALKNFPRTDTERATKIAATYLRKHFGRKINNDWMLQLLNEASELIGINLEGDRAQRRDTRTEITMSVNETRPEETETQSNHQIEINKEVAQQSETHRKRQFTEISPAIPLRNFYANLSEDDEEDNDEAEECDNECPITNKKRDKKATPKQKNNHVVATNPTEPTTCINTAAVGISREETPTAEKTSTEHNRSTHSEPEEMREQEYRSDNTRRLSLSLQEPSKPIIHDKTNKSVWRINPSNRTKTMVIADSNFRWATKLPSHWEIHVFPGMNLENATKLINNSNLDRQTTLRDIIISVGINNRNCAPVTVNCDMGKLYATLSKTGKNIYFNGVSIPQELNARETEALKDLNQKAHKRFQQRYIYPLDSHEVCVNPSDIHRIHYDAVTIGKICQNISAYFLRVTKPQMLPK